MMSLQTGFMWRTICAPLTALAVTACAWGTWLQCFERVTREEPPVLLEQAVDKRHVENPEVMSKQHESGLTTERVFIAQDFYKGVRKIAEKKYEIDRALIDEASSDIFSSSCSRIVPAFEDQKPIGFKLFSIRPGSLASRLGIHNADIVRRINGHEWVSPDNALKVYEKLVASDHIVVDITRRGVPMTFEYTIVDNQEVQQ